MRKIGHNFLHCAGFIWNHVLAANLL
jgi:hypothetical protein